MPQTRLQKYILIPLLILTMMGPYLTPYAQGFSFPNRYDLVAILVDQSLYENTTDYAGAAVKALNELNRQTASYK